MRWNHHLFQLALLLAWVAIGTALRFANLAAKAPWTDEFATLVFSLGHSFETVPLDQIITTDQLLAPLQVDSSRLSDVTRYLLSEDVHPPFYFGLAHLWLQLFSTESGLVSLWGARALPALLGVLSIPAIYGLGLVTLRSQIIAHLAAAFMAVSPYGVYLAQEARHYTLSIVWVTASLTCLGIALRWIQRQRSLPWLTVLSWIVVNSLGVATHFFFLLTLVAETIALIVIGVVRNGRTVNQWLSPPWPRIYLAMAGTAAGIAVWIPLWLTIRSREITQWIQSDDGFNLLSLINPLFQAAAAWVTMVLLLPVESSNLPVAIAAGAAMIVVFLWMLPLLWRGFRQQWQSLPEQTVLKGFTGFVVGAIALFFIITYGFGADLTRGARYSFVYFPGVIALLACSLAACWRRSAPWVTRAGHKPDAANAGKWTAIATPILRGYGKYAVIALWLVGLAGGLTVSNNLGYRKYYRPEQLISQIQQLSNAPVVIATTQSTLVHIGEMMGVAWQIEAESAATDVEPRFLLAHEDALPCEENCQATDVLKSTVTRLAEPNDFWLVNFDAPTEIDEYCALDDAPPKIIYGYRYQLYHCHEES
ncbi:MAG: glycosyltransferase family 39 protein [Thainema sp.]